MYDDSNIDNTFAPAKQSFKNCHTFQSNQKTRRHTKREGAGSRKKKERERERTMKKIKLKIETKKKLKKY